MSLQANILKLLPECCEADFVAVAGCPPAGQEAVRAHLPEARTAVVLAHRIANSLEWVWFAFKASRREQTCAADLHAQAVTDRVAGLLQARGHRSVVAPYPGTCGLAFKALADRTGLGKVGDNGMFLHRQWGPWAHLRVVLTDAEIPGCQPLAEGEPCSHCGRCAEACPAKAIGEKGLDSKACADFMERERARLGPQGGYWHKCEVCARVCPVGQVPTPMEIKTKA